VLAFAKGYGLGVPQVSFEKPASMEDVTIQLAKDDVPIAGRVIDLQGRPVAGVLVRVRGIQMPRDGNMTTLIDALNVKKEGLSPQQDLMIGFHDIYGGWNLDSIFPPATTDAAGRFSIKGVGRERMADLLIKGPTIEANYAYAMTRPCETIQVPAYKRVPPYSNPPNPLYIHYGATFNHVAAPSKPVIGVVCDTDTGMPIPGAVVEQSDALPVPDSRPIDDRIRLRAVTDGQGRYRITGLPWGKRNILHASPPAGKPYLMSAKEVSGGPGLEPVAVDFSLKRGVWIDVKVTDQLTAKPVPCHIQYFAFVDNPFLQQAIGFTTGSRDGKLAEDGTLRLLGLPGRGLVAVRALEEGYRYGVGSERIQGRKGDSPGDVHFQTIPSECFPNHFHAVAEITPTKETESVSCSLLLDPGRALAGTLVGPDSKPLAGAQTNGLSGGMRFWTHEPLRSAEFIVKALKPDETRRLLFLHKDKGLAGTLLIRGDEKGPLTVKLEPWGVVTGKVLTTEGKPLTDAQIVTLFGDIVGPQGAMPRPLDAGSLPYPFKPDKDGRFRIEGFVPGLKYDLHVVKSDYVTRSLAAMVKNLSVKSGEIKDLGDVRIEWGSK
jgi:hypothetical protein